MIKKYNFLVVTFFRVTDPYSGSSEVSFNFFKNIPSKKKKLFQFSNNDKKYKDVISIKIENTKIGKILNLKKLADSIIDYCKNKKNIIIVIEGASWVGYSFILYQLLNIKLKNIKFIYHSHNIEYLLRKKKENLIITTLTKFFENFIAKRFDLFTVVSKVDLIKLKELYNIHPTILSNGAQLPMEVEKIKRKKFYFKYIFFCGSIEYLPNLDALKILVKEIMPLVIAKNPKIKLIVSGNKYLPFKEKFLINAGFVSKLSFYKYLSGSSLFVNPIRTGFGSQLKTINALAFGKTIIASKLAVNGIDINNKFKNLYITNNKNKFANLIIKKINSKRINKISKDYYSKKYLMKNIVKNFFLSKKLFNLLK